MGTENSAWRRMLGATAGRTECLAGWERYFAGGARTLRRFCIPTGAPAEFYPHPSGGLDLVIEREAAGGFRAVCPDTGADDWVPPIRLTFEEAQGHRFDLKGLVKEIGARCGIADDPTAEDGGMFRLGSCGRKAAYAFLGDGGDAPARIAGLVNGREGAVGCVLIPCEDGAAAELGAALGVAVVPLHACFEVGADGIQGTCGRRCLTKGRRLGNGNVLRERCFYVVNERFRIEGNYSKVTALVSKETPWQPQPFTRMILRVLLNECNHTGLTGAEVYRRAKAAFEGEHPESRGCQRGQEPYPGYASLVHFFRVQRKQRKKVHPLYRELTISGKKPAVYSYEGKVAVRESAQSRSDTTPDII